VVELVFQVLLVAETRLDEVVVVGADLFAAVFVPKTGEAGSVDPDDYGQEEDEGHTNDGLDQGEVPCNRKEGLV